MAFRPDVSNIGGGGAPRNGRWGSNNQNPGLTAGHKKQINDVYQNLLGRDADESGMQYYGSKLARGESIASIEEDIMGSEEARTNGKPFGKINPDVAFEGDQGASNLLGALHRQKWNDWKQRFKPVVKQLANEATDPNAARDAANQARSSVGLAFDTSQTINDQNRERYGVSLTPDQQQAQQRTQNINRSGAMVTAGNEARISAQDRQQKILAGGMGLQNIPTEVMGQ